MPQNRAETSMRVTHLIADPGPFLFFGPNARWSAKSRDDERACGPVLRLAGKTSSSQGRRFVIRAVTDYLRSECFPHWRSLVLDSQIPLSLGAVALALYRPGVPGTFTVDKLTETSLAYAAASFGFAITIYTLALTFPQPETVRLLVTHREEGDPTDAYRKLLFVFSWTAFCQGVLVAIAFTARLSLKLDQPVFRPEAHLVRNVLVGITIFALCYSVLQFLSALMAVAQLGRIVARKTREKALGDQQRSALTSVKKHVG
jgi:hypothetical protein